MTDLTDADIDADADRVNAAPVRTSAQPLAGRRALVTGGASGIGAAVVRALAARGAHVVVADIDTAGATALAEEVGGSIWIVNLMDTAALTDDALASALAGVDILVNNAGIQRINPIQDFKPADFHNILALMLEAPFLLIRAVLPQMYAANFGRIINVSSVHGIRASPYKSAYVSAKHGLEGLSKVTALEGGAHGVTSNCVAPGYVRTPLVEKQITDQALVHGIPASEVLSTIMLTESAIKRLVEPAEVGSLVAWLASDDAAMVTGASYTMDGGWSAR
ncbi:3-hydroxybutyrate dehydrogenase [Cryobacterium sp. Hb1]|uniref:3-hydroxybutyrate dehydrogenase n=1 Tax=Cryobacterium sp. Hb1 TaxID=1259147 RepID=UPI0010699420|nr:3-hydroxybutyrate dehydrogenase [Cryobacterium sp. Hb1]TFD67060.1 SDR family oxidoreductase [Cryobacterium sp. Hb1]